MNTVQWAAGQVGRLVTAPGGAGGQCVDLANVYLLARGTAPVRRNAAEWAVTPIGKRWRWVSNGPGNAPGVGDVVVWHADAPDVGVGPYGHVAVCVAADSMALLTLDQDWPYGSPVALVWHTYRGIVGWWAWGG